MSYCRFSTDDFSSDVYVYEAEEGIVIHVANNRLEFTEPLPDVIDVKELTTEDDFRRYLDRERKVGLLVATATHIPIDHPDAGGTIVCGSPAEAYARLAELRSQGLYVPGGALAILADEADINPG